MPSNFEVIYYEALDSTNSEAWRLIDRGIGSEGVVVVAKTQTSGRGQRDHLWQSHLGGLYLSVIFHPHLPAQMGAQMTIWSAWGIAKALRTVVPDLKIKWLNDLVVANRKLGGILTETRVTGGIITHAVLGVGINWLNEVPTVGIALADLASNVENLETLESLVLSGINQGWHYWRDQGIEAILPKYLQLLSTHSVQVGDRFGTITAITSSGDLVVQWHNDLGISKVAPSSISLGYGI